MPDLVALRAANADRWAHAKLTRGPEFSPVAKLLNDSINETLSRTILTTGTAILVIIALYLLGGPVIHGFAFAPLVGFVTGTYSTVFVAGAIVVALERAPGTALRQRRAAST